MRRLRRWTLVPLLVTSLVLASPAASWAASGGRIGGGSFRSSPSIPRSYGGGGARGSYGGGYRGGYGGGYGVPYGGGYRGGYGGGIGFPFIVPFFGFGGGGLFGLLLLMVIAGVLVNAVRGAGNGSLAGEEAPRTFSGSVALAQVQVGLLASARQLQDDLRRLARTADTSTPAGLQAVLQETTLALLRNPDLWVYANSELGSVPMGAAESTFNRLALAERSKLQREVTTNVAGQRSAESASLAGGSDASSDVIAVTILAACRSRLPLKAVSTAEELRDALQVLGAVGADDLLALEVIWQPEGLGEVLSTEELLTTYPQMQHL